VGWWGSLMTHMAGSVTTQSIAFNYVMGAVRVRRGSDSSESACCTAGPGSALQKRPSTKRKQ
jgi:hypothetical protein